MSDTKKAALWVVYRMTVYGKPSAAAAVCEQSEWDALELARPGYHTLVLAGIPCECEAERVARGGPADAEEGKPPRRKVRRRAGGGDGEGPAPAGLTSAEPPP